MKNIEYEYSINVPSLEPYINYCKEQGYNFIEESNQTRTLYRKPNGTMARITNNEVNGVIKKLLDFKEDNWVEGQVLKQHKESLPIEYTNDEAINSILDFLEYKKDNTLIRKRYVFEKGKVKFELDEYTQPYNACVVGIEGEKVQVDKVYEEIRALNSDTV